MSRFSVGILFFLLSPTALMAGNLGVHFDPIPGVDVSNEGIAGSASGLSAEYSLIQFNASSNTGVVSSHLLDQGSTIKLPKDTQLLVFVKAAGTSFEVSVTDQSDWKTMIATTQLNNTSEVSSVGDFQVSARKNESRLVSAVGNKIVYQNNQ